MSEILNLWYERKKWRILYSFVAFGVVNVVYSFSFPNVYTALMYYLFPFMVILGLLANRDKYKWEEFTFAMPLSHTQIATGRLVFVLILTFLYLIFNIIITYFVNSDLVPSVNHLILSFSVTMIIISSYIIIRDLTIGFARRKGMNPVKTQSGIMAAIAGMYVLGVAVYKYNDIINLKPLIEFFESVGVSIAENMLVTGIILIVVAITELLYTLKSMSYRTYFRDE